MKDFESMPVGVVIERRKSQSRWAEFSWRAIGVIPGAPEIDDWVTLRAEDDWVHFHIATLPLELFPKETDGYRYNLTCETPRVFVVLREGEEAEDREIEAALVSVCPHEAQDYLDTGEDQVDAVVMPDVIRSWVGAYINQHHVDEPFKKRRQRSAKDNHRAHADRPPGARSARRSYDDG